MDFTTDQAEQLIFEEINQEDYMRVKKDQKSRRFIRTSYNSPRKSKAGILQEPSINHKLESSPNQSRKIESPMKMNEEVALFFKQGTMKTQSINGFVRRDTINLGRDKNQNQLSIDLQNSSVQQQAGKNNSTANMTKENFIKINQIIDNLDEPQEEIDKQNYEYFQFIQGQEETKSIVKNYEEIYIKQENEEQNNKLNYKLQITNFKKQIYIVFQMEANYQNLTEEDIENMTIEQQESLMEQIREMTKQKEEKLNEITKELQDAQLTQNELRVFTKESQVQKRLVMDQFREIKSKYVSEYREFTLENQQKILNMRRAIRVVNELMLGLQEIRNQEFIKYHQKQISNKKVGGQHRRSYSLSEIYQSEDSLPYIHYRLEIKCDDGKVRDRDFIIRVEEEAFTPQQSKSKQRYTTPKFKDENSDPNLQNLNSQNLAIDQSKEPNSDLLSNQQSEELSNQTQQEDDDIWLHIQTFDKSLMQKKFWWEHLEEPQRIKMSESKMFHDCLVNFLRDQSIQKDVNQIIA